MTVASTIVVPGPAGAQTAPACAQVPEPARWTTAGTPDTGLANGYISAHRAGTTLAPENTLDAIRVAAAYGVDAVELDFRTTADGVIVVSHDDSVDRTTDGTGRIAEKTAAEIVTLNAADFPPFNDPARSEYAYFGAGMPTAQEAVTLAGQLDVGVEFDIKSVPDPSELANMAAAAGILEKSFFNNPHDPRMRAAQPDARFIYNINDTDPPAFLYGLASSGTATYFGSKLLEFTPERLVAIHDGCGIAIPHSYDSDPPGGEADDIAAGRAIGTDGNQVNAVDVAVGALQRPVSTLLVIDDAGRICLQNARNRMGLPYKSIETEAGAVVTARDGCVVAPTGVRSARFTGDRSALASTLAPPPVVPEAPTPLLLLAAGLATVGLVGHRARHCHPSEPQREMS